MQSPFIQAYSYNLSLIKVKATLISLRRKRFHLFKILLFHNSDFSLSSYNWSFFLLLNFFFFSRDAMICFVLFLSIYLSLNKDLLVIIYLGQVTQDGSKSSSSVSCCIEKAVRLTWRRQGPRPVPRCWQVLLYKGDERVHSWGPGPHLSHKRHSVLRQEKYASSTKEGLKSPLKE